jgi:hypothetical protein
MGQHPTSSPGLRHLLLTTAPLSSNWEIKQTSIDMSSRNTYLLGASLLLFALAAQA